ncbi:MAG: hypothetical protein J6X84_06220 [Treponema sp.]|nr:hypothetical protein [Treponema sp.]
MTDNLSVEMTSGQKIASSLLAAFALFAIFVLSFQSKLFRELETRFYAQSKIAENTRQLDKISESCDLYISDILSLVEKGENAWTKNAAVRSYYVQNPSESDVNQRRRQTEALFAQIPSLSGIRIVDKNGKSVHYSSFDETDLLKQNGITKFYKNYNDIEKDANEISFETLRKITSETKAVLLCDQTRGRLILSVPFCWVDGIYSGISLFYLNLFEVEKELVSRDVISLGQGMSLFSDDDFNGGIVFNLPFGNKNDFKLPTLNYWKNRSEIMSRGGNYQQPEKLVELPDGRFYVALSSNRIGKIRVSGVYTSDVFELSSEIRLIIYISIFISILLIVFLIFSFFGDPVVQLQKRIKKLQLGIIENYLDGKEKKEWSDVARLLRQRRNDLSDDIIKSLHVHSKKRRDELSDYLEKNWEEIFAIFETKTGSQNTSGNAAGGSSDISGASIQEIRRMLEEVLQSKNFVSGVAAASGTAVVAGGAAAVQKIANADEVDEIEEIDEIEEAEDAESLDEVEELAEDAESLDEVEELAEDAESLDEVEELAEDAEELDEVEELAEDAEELDEVEELAEDAEELDEVEELAEDAESLDEVEELAEDAEELDEVEELAEDAESLDEVEDLTEDSENFEESKEVPQDSVEDANENSAADETQELEVAEKEQEFEDVEEFAEDLSEANENPEESGENAEITGVQTECETVEPETAEEFEDSELLTDVDELSDDLEAAEPLSDSEVEEFDELDELEEFVEEPKENSADIALLFAKPVYEFSSSPETYFPTEELATVDNLFAEELSLGSEFSLTNTNPTPITVYSFPTYSEEEFASVDDIIESKSENRENQNDEQIAQAAESDEQTENQSDFEELTEEVPAFVSEPSFSMTNFGENISADVPELDSAGEDSNANAIVEKDGIFSIAENLDCSGVVQDSDFKQLVDSIL